MTILPTETQNNPNISGYVGMRQNLWLSILNTRMNMHFSGFFDVNARALGLKAGLEPEMLV